MHSHVNSGASRRLILSLGLTSLVLAAEVIGGIWTGSLALLSDAAHVFMDIFALALSYLALRLSNLPANDRHSYGYHRLEVLAALVNGVTLAVIAVWIWGEAIERFQSPQDIRSLEMLIIAAIGLAVNLVVAFVLGSHTHTHNEGEEHHHSDGEQVPARQDLNLRAAYLHVVGDAISSVGVILAGILVSITRWQWVDPLISVMIGALIMISAYRVTRSSLHILIEGTPEGLSVEEISTAMRQVNGVEEVHDLHVWSICSGNIALSAHIVAVQEFQSPLADIQEVLHRRFGIHHTTIQVDNGDKTNCGGCA
ncbi:MAG TPA: cation diffusion facilitator family transporter [Anaerolineaceae bacterium]|nr:cation diffusion facilitator family transporter [Anaerolineaceae bacterium]